MSDISNSESGGKIIKESFSEALSSRYLSYALSTITARALPDVRDGLKPVQRRILYAMRELKLRPETAPKKCAKIVGEVMGNYHPHGDGAIYDALVRLAQSFSVRYPLVDGQGNFGNVDGDGAAAMRYTESRMTLAAELLLEGIDQDAVDFKTTYDEEDEEPTVLPAGFPNLLANGTTGIAVGMATSIPPHNVSELIDASIHLIKAPRAHIDTLLEYVPGPDFPTGGVIVEPKETIREAYETGKGGFRLRAKWELETLERGQWQIVVTEIPYQVQKSKLIERLAELIDAKKAPLLGDVRDESAEDIRLVLEPRAKTVDPEILMESLFKLSELETRFSLNMNVLDHGAPKTMGLREALRAFLDHRQEVLVRRSRYRLDKIEARLELLDGYLIAYLNIDEVIRIIREEDDAKAELIKAFSLNERQAEAVLNLRLRALRKLEEFEIRKEHGALQTEREEIKALLADSDIQWKIVTAELREVKKILGAESPYGARRSQFAEAPEIDTAAAMEAMIPKEPITVILSKMGWVRALKGHSNDLEKLKFKEGDALEFAVKANTADKLILMASDGRAFTLEASKLPGGRGNGEPIRLAIELAESEQIVALEVFKANEKRLVASSAGHGFIVASDDLLSNKKAGKQVVVPANGAHLQFVKPLIGDSIAVVGDNRKLLIFLKDELPEMARGKGVKLQNYKDGGLADILSFEAETGFGWIDSGGRQHSLSDWENWIGKRAAAGRMVPRGFNKNGKFEG